MSTSLSVGADYSYPTGGKQQFPPKGADPGVIKKFMDEFVYYRSTYRAELMREWNLAKAYYESIQWVRLDARSDPRRAIRWTQQDPSDEIPKPVQNECLPIVDNEIAKLGRRQSRPYVKARVGGDAKLGAAQKATQVLLWHLEKLRWPRLRRRGISKEVMFGTGIWKSYWRTDYTDTISLGVPGAVECKEGCGFMLSQSSIPSAMAPKNVSFPDLLKPQTSLDFPDDHSFEETKNFDVGGCLNCGSPLQPARLLPEEAQGVDSFGRPLSSGVPIGDAGIEPVSPFDFFPENEGIDVNPDDMTEFGQATPRHLDWIAANFQVEIRDDGYYKDGERIVADDPIRIAEQHPILGEYAYWSQGPKGSIDRNLYRNHTMVREVYKLPSKRYPFGRAIVIAGKIILMDDDLMVESKNKPGTYYPRVKYCVARFWPRDGEFFAQGILVPLFSPQNRINMTYSQIVDSRERHGTDGIMLSKGMKLLSPGWTKNFTGRVVVVEMDPELPGTWPQPFQARLMDVRVFQEVDRTREYMQQASGAQDVDIGKAPRNVSAATAIQLLQERASERRDPREQELRDCFQELFSHQLLLLSEKVIEQRDFLIPKGKAWQEAEWIGSDLAGLTDVMVDEEASYDLRAFEREGVIQAINMKLYEVDTPFSRREAIKAMGLPLSIMDEVNVQIDDADRKWFAFKQEQTLPTIDPTEDSHFLHWQVYGKYLKSDDGIGLKKQANWEALLPWIAGWDERLQMAEAMDRQMRQLMAMQAQGQTDPFGQPIQLPADPAEALLPPALEQRVYLVWMKMLTAALQRAQTVQAATQVGQPPPPGPPIVSPPAFTLPLDEFGDLFLRFKAVTEAHRIYAERKKAGAQISPILAAPGGGMTPEGTEPTPGQPSSTLGAGSQQGPPAGGPGVGAQ